MSNDRPLIFVDLDDTLFQTLRKCPPDVPAERLTPLGFARDGSLPWPPFDRETRQVYDPSTRTAAHEAPMAAAPFLP